MTENKLTIELIKEMNNSTLIELLEKSKTDEQRIDPDFFDSILSELDLRELTNEESIRLENWVNLSVNENSSKAEKTIDTHINANKESVRLENWVNLSVNENSSKAEKTIDSHINANKESLVIPAKEQNRIAKCDDGINKVVNVTLWGGIIGLIASSPQNRLNEVIKTENAAGWRVVQIIPSASGNILLYLLRLVLLLITLFLFTTSNGFYVVMEKNENLRKLRGKNERYEL
jgi:nucleoid DNA-binding protein